MDEHDLELLTTACSQLPPPQGNYLVDDYVSNLLLTVLDFQMQTVAVERAFEFYRQNRWNDVRTHEDVVGLLGRFSDDRSGNEEIARYLWDNRHWARVGLLRRLVAFFGEERITTQEALTRWANTSTFERDFRGRVPGMALAIYNWIVMRVGVETVKPDVHVMRFVEGTLQRQVPPTQAVELLEEVAYRLGWKAHELDWRIWEDGFREPTAPRLSSESSASPDSRRSNVPPKSAAGTRRGKWTAFYDWLNNELGTVASVTMTVDEIIARTGTKDKSVRTRSFWLLNQRGAKDFDGFLRSGIGIAFCPDCPGIPVETVTFSPTANSA